VMDSVPVQSAPVAPITTPDVPGSKTKDIPK